MTGAVGQATLTIPPWTPTEERPHAFRVLNPTRKDVENAANRDDYPRVFGVGGMEAWLIYAKPHRPEGHFYNVDPTSHVFVGSRNPKYRSPNYETLVSVRLLNVFRKWWCQLPSTVSERKYMFGQLRDVISALALGDAPLALSLLSDVNLATSDGTHIASHVKQSLADAIESRTPWDYRDPKTRGDLPYTFPEDRTTNSGTTSVTVSQTIGSVSVTAG